jgi:hypothetical protein
VIAAVAECASQVRLPPYGRKLAALRAAGMAPTSAVLVVDGWAPIENLREYAPWVLVIPDDEPAQGFDFHVVAGLFVLVMSATIERIDEIALRVLRFSPKTVFGWFETEARLCCYTRVRE